MKTNGVIMQYFHWYIPHDIHLWTQLKNDASHLKNIGISAIWMPPAYKGAGGQNDTGYGVYDLYDLGEFDQKGTTETKYGSKDEYLSCIQSLHEHQLQIYADIVLNHRIGADEFETVTAKEVNRLNTQQIISGDEQIRVATRFTFPNRHQKYSDTPYYKNLRQCYLQILLHSLHFLKQNESILQFSLHHNEDSYNNKLILPLF